MSATKKRYAPGVQQRASRQGFTIAELLIVITVIAILAVIGFVSYRGVTQKAERTSIAVTVNAYKDALGLYKIKHGNYPLFSGPAARGACLGAGYPTNYDADPSGDCFGQGWFADFSYNESTELADAVRPYLPDLPTVQAEGFMAGGQRYNGLIYLYDPNFRVNGTWQPKVMIFYSLPGANQDCEVPVVRYVGTGSRRPGNPSDYLFETANPNRWTASRPGATACAYLLP